MTCKQKRNSLWILGLVVLLALPVSLLAQGGATGAISGTVADPTGAVVPNAKVDVVRTAAGEILRSTTSNGSGLFTVTLLPADTYSLRVSAAGFAQTELTGVVVRVTETTRLTVSLSAKTVQEHVEVKGETEEVKTTDATTGESLSATSITELPLATRNFQQLLALSSGASSSLNAASQLGRGNVKIDVNGGREDDNSYQIDGIGANDSTNMGELANTPLPSPDSIQEFKVATSLYDATQGRNGGGNINAILKSGTKSFHGDVFEYFRNTDLNANDPFLEQKGLSRPVIKQNIFGGSLGGPVGPKAKLGFFFVNYQGTRQQSGDSPGTILSTQTLPYVPASARQSPAAMASAFSLPQGSVDPVAFAFLSFQSNQFGPGAGGYLYPLPNVDPGTTPGYPVSFRVSIPGTFTDNQFTATWDRDFRGGKDCLSGRFFFSDSETYEPFGADSFGLMNGTAPAENSLNFPMDIPLRNRFASLAETHVFTDHLLNEARFGVNVISYFFDNISPVTAQQLGIDRPTNNVTSDIYRFILASEGLQMGPFPNQPLHSLSDGLVLVDTVSYTRGSHSFRFGGQIDHTDIRRYNPMNDNGDIIFAPGTSPFNPAQQYTDFQNFLVGNLCCGSGVDGGLANHDYKVPAFALFVQDDYRATSTLTLNLGFRAEWDGAIYDANCYQGAINPALANTTGDPFIYPKCVNKLNLGVVGTMGRDGLNNNYATVMEPRIGLAYDVLGHHTTSIRAGYGIYSVREDVGSLENQIIAPPMLVAAEPSGINPNGGMGKFFITPPYVVPAEGQTSASFAPQASFFEGFSSTGCSASGMPLAPTTNTATGTPCFSGDIYTLANYTFPLRFQVPTIQQWNLGVERSLGRNWTLKVGYVGTKGTHLRELSMTDMVAPASPENPITVKVNDPSSPNYGQTFAITQNTGANLLARAPYLGTAPYGFSHFGEDANSRYNSLQVSVSHRFSKSLSLQSAYTFSKSIDNTSTSSVNGLTRFNNQLTGADSEGLSDFDRTHRWTTNFDYTLPFFAQRHDFIAHVLGAWEVNGVFTLQSGTPFSVVDSAGGSEWGLAGSGVVTPIFAPGYNCSNALASGNRVNGYLNTAAFLPAPVDPNSPDGSTGFGEVPRTCFRGPHQINLDFSVGKEFRLGEHQQLKFMAEFFNLTNTSSYANPAVTDIETAAGSPTFGKINQVVGTPRLIQFALKYAF